GIRSSHARSALRVRVDGADARPPGHHRRRRRRSPSARNDRREDHPAGPGSSRAVEDIERSGLAPVDRADARRGSRRHLRHRRRGRHQRGAVRRGDPRQHPARSRGGARIFPRPANGRRTRQPRSQNDARQGPMTVGIVGAGQLGRMLALAGYPLGLDFLFLDPVAAAPAGQLAPLLKGAFTDRAPLAELARRCEVLTFDWENVSVHALRALPRGTRISPPIPALAAAQDRVSEKRLFEQLAVPTTRWRAVSSAAQLHRALRDIGLPGVIKTRRMGYDGKGQSVVRTVQEADAAWSRLGSVPLLYEELVTFDREVSIIGARSRRGEIAIYPLNGNVHCEGILRLTRAPYGPAAWQRLAAAYLKRVLERFRYTGILTIEFFVRSGRLIANEMAPRVHNSGHWTIE